MLGVLAGCAGGSQPAAPGHRDRGPAPRRDASGPSHAPDAMHPAPHAAVPILMYHVIGYRGPATPYPALWVRPAEFVAEVRALAAHGYHGVTLQQVWNAWHSRGRLPARPVVISFDDGYYGQYRFALPALRRLGWPGVLNLKVGNLSDLGGPRTIRAMIAAGWEVDDHTFTHPDLRMLDDAHLRREVAGSRSFLRRLTGAPINFFCYPSGRYDARVIAAVRAAGYLAATSTRDGLARRQERFTLARVRVYGGEGETGVVHKLERLARDRQVRPPPAARSDSSLGRKPRRSSRIREGGARPSAPPSRPR